MAKKVELSEQVVRAIVDPTKYSLNPQVPIKPGDLQQVFMYMAGRNTQEFMTVGISGYFMNHPSLDEFVAQQGKKPLREIEREAIAQKILQTDNVELIIASGLTRRKMHKQIIEGVKDHIEI